MILQHVKPVSTHAKTVLPIPFVLLAKLLPIEYLLQIVAVLIITMIPILNVLFVIINVEIV
jgi:hypothetical protein